MAIPNDVKLVVESTLISYIEQKIPPHIRNKLYLSYQFSGNSVILLENRPYIFKTGRVDRIGRRQIPVHYEN